MKFIRKFLKWFIGLFHKQAKLTAPKRIPVVKVVPTSGRRHCFVYIDGFRTRKPNKSLRAD